MVNIIIRVLIIYIVVIGVVRLMGKRQIGEMEPFELVITLIIADLATIPMAEQTIPIWYGVIPLLVICVIHYVASLLTKTSPFMRDIISGKPVIVIDESGIDFKELKKLNISGEELMEALRNLDYFDMSEINYAILERNGKITVIPKSANMPTTREDMKIITPENDVFYAVIENGKILYNNFKEMGLLHKPTIDIILHRIYGSISDIQHNTRYYLRNILFCSISAGGDVYIQRSGENVQNFKIKITQKCFTNAQQKENLAIEGA